MRVRTIIATTAILVLTVGTATWVRAAGGERTISLHNIHTKETVSVVYKRDGRFVDAGLQKVNHVMRDWRRNESTTMEPELIDLLWQMHQELGSKEPIHIISGYRSRATNDQLRRSVGGQASESRHILGKAADVHFPDVPVRKLRYAALVQEKGGVGYYPTSNIPFVHVDTDRVRSWPRLPRHELALLFPSGSTRHAAADGGPLTKDDVRAAQGRNGDLTQQIAEFHEQRRAPGLGNASQAERRVAGRPVPRLAAIDEPRLLEKPTAVSQHAAGAFHVPTAEQRAKLTEFLTMGNAAAPLLVSGPMPARRQQADLPSLTGTPGPAPRALPVAADGAKIASLDPRNAGRGLTDIGGWVPAPAYDEEHPEELSYRPFPIAPYLTESAGEPLMVELLPYDVAKTLEFLDQPGAMTTLRLRPGRQTGAQVSWQQFTGPAVGLAKLDAAKADLPVTSTGTAQRPPVKTSQK